MPGILIGTDLAETLEVNVGDRVQLISPHGTLTPLGMFARPRRSRSSASSASGCIEFDSEYGFITIDVAKRVLGEDQPVFIAAARRRHVRARSEVVDAIVERFGADYMPQDWSDMNKSLFSALWLEKMAISITIGLIVMVAALNIVASLILLVMEKSRDIAILKTMGSPATSIRRIFMLQGLIIGLVGTAAGADRRLRADLRARSLQADLRPDRRLPDLLRAVHAAAARLRRRHRVGDRDLLRRDDLSVAPGGAARSGAGAQVSMTAIDAECVRSDDSRGVGVDRQESDA